MANWKIKINVGDLWEKYQNDEDFNLIKFIKALVSRLEDKVDEVSEKLGEDEAIEFDNFIEQLSYNVDNEDEFDYIWQDLYDWCDNNLVWLGTF